MLSFARHRSLVSAVRFSRALPYASASSYSTEKPPFDKILIANRGEIACRVIRTCQRMGIKTVAVFSQADSNALHVRRADEKVFIGPPPSRQSYLVMENIIKACKETGAQAVHPGYGFLSENQHFVEMLGKNGIVFIGPPTKAIHAMGDKIESKKIAQAAGVNIIPGFLGEVHTNEQVLEKSNAIGYPVMIKASAGGGGKGMRIAWNDAEAIEAYKISKQEAMASFGDDRILIEKYIDRGRHIEIQVLADQHGNAIYLNERECSIQRRNQKVVEEAPSPFIDPVTRKLMGAQAVALCKQVGYTSAGTVEMLVDHNKNFYFLEMNTRLQVEHPITEEITKVDLVEQMIRVAAGQKLKLRQEDIGIHGWAIESRVYAEDPLRKFLPSIGSFSDYVEPSGPGIRVDSGIYEGGEISIYYDPLIAKLVTHADTRAEAISRMGDALDQYVIGGLKHNVNFLRAVMENPVYLSGEYNTKFIPEQFPHFHGIALTHQDRFRISAAAALLHTEQTLADSELEGQFEHYQPTFDSKLEVVLNEKDSKHAMHFDVVPSDDGYTVSSGNDSVLINVEKDGLRRIFSINGERVVMQLHKRFANTWTIQYKGTKWDLQVYNAKEAALVKHMKPIPKIDTSKSILTPMAGSVVSISVKPGDHVNPGQEVAVVEAMKMQNILRTERDGKIAKVHVKQGDDIQVDQILIEFE